ncbi:hypothetical protein CC1G_09779 [Coprinopsis cinerea okayama7|uniref:Uncharacterized protein n=1 Tax=Coprinopsis cinerea (strain Okayama-7 / 130 / ATCC MYA-4618 / FGSC 9003) TaxID=240176 RepID=A8PE48_COPC7|nr:hypothetical protein CC1G_09779 [Coprinopsis cinerea okayama7\|eukprot:XP_001840728.1 hypothetical protein CC1G_09779 [Coprinopsis cinerea okayama7\
MPTSAAIALWVVLSTPSPDGDNGPALMEAKLKEIRENAPDADMRRAAACLLPGDVDEIAIELVAAKDADERNALERIIEGRVWFRRWFTIAQVYRRTNRPTDDPATERLNQIVVSITERLGELFALIAHEDEAIQVATNILNKMLESDA